MSQFRFNSKALVKKLATSLFLSAAILSIANIDALMHEPDPHDFRQQREKLKVAKDKLRQRLEIADQKPRARDLTNMLRDSLAQDEFGDNLPFASLSTLDPLTRMMGKGVKHFERTVYRSPDYQGENGYDVVHYDIEHADGKHSSVLAYLDRPSLTVSRNVGTPDPRVPIVMILEARNEEAAYSLYRMGDLVEQSKVPSADISSLVAERIALSVPFLSVSR